jgi:hypothetical protein
MSPLDITTHPDLQKMQPDEAAAWQSEIDYVRHISAQGGQVPRQSITRILAENVMQMILVLELLSIATYALWTWVLNR